MLSSKLILYKNKKSVNPLKAKKFLIRKTDDVPYVGFSYESLISDPIGSGKGS